MKVTDVAVMFCLLLWPAGASAGPEEAHSLYLPTGPAPQGGYVPYTGPVDERGEKVIGGVPGYQWQHGCGPTAAGMVIGYWDGHGFPAMIPGDASSQTWEVDHAIAGNWHYQDYSLPLDYRPGPLLPDKSEPPPGDEHPSNCLADFMRTSWSAAGLYYGWSYFSDVDDSLYDYTAYVDATHGADYYCSTWNEYWGSFTWEDFVEEIDADRPVALLVDTDGDGSTDHFVTGIGYRDVHGYPEYACLDTWAPPDYLRWEDFQAMSPGNPWGVFGATFFRPSRDCNGNDAPDGEDIAEGTSADCNANYIPDECDIAEGTSPDVNGNGIPDECLEPPQARDGEDGKRKNRYLSFDPHNTEPAAFQVELTASDYFPGSVGVLGWVGEPDENDICRVEGEAYFSDSWPAVVHVADCEIVPAATYALRATADQLTFTNALELRTISRPVPVYWGDVVGEKFVIWWTEPNGVVNMDDVMAAVQKFKQVEDAPLLTWVDVDPEVPNAVLNFTDILRIVQGFKGEPYPFSDPGACPPPSAPVNGSGNGGGDKLDDADHDSA